MSLRSNFSFVIFVCEINPKNQFQVLKSIIADAIFYKRNMRNQTVMSLVLFYCVGEREVIYIGFNLILLILLALRSCFLNFGFGAAMFLYMSFPPSHASHMRACFVPCGWSSSLLHLSPLFPTTVKSKHDKNPSIW